MSFGFSVGDFVMLVQMAHRSFRNCKKAGEEYTEITCEVRCLHSVLRTLRSEAQRPDSKIFMQNRSTTAELLSIKDGCKNVLDNLDSILVKYEGLKADGQVGASKRLWQRIRFGSKVEELGDIRSKLITYTSTISILIDTMQIQAVDRVESKIDGGFAEVASQFESMRKNIFDIASFARAEQRKGANMSSLSLSTYAGDEKAVWQDFRRELIKKGFRSQSLEKYKYVLQAYMIKLDQSGLLDQPSNSNSDLNDGAPWWMKKLYTETINSLADLQPTENPLLSIERGEPLPFRKVPSNLPSNNISGAVRKKEIISHKIPLPSKIVENPNAEQNSDPDVPSKTHNFGVDTSTLSSLDENLEPGPPVEKPAELELSEVDRERPFKPNLRIEMVNGVETNEKTNRNRTTSTEQWSQRKKLVQPRDKPEVSAAAESDDKKTFDGKPQHTPKAHFQDPNTTLKKSALEDLHHCVKTVPWLVDARIAIGSSSSLGEIAESGVRERESRPYAATKRAIVGPIQTPDIIRYPLIPEKSTKKQLRGILKCPTEKFPEDHNPVREGVAPLKDAGKNGIPPGARWTKISRGLVNPEALELGNERFEARPAFVIVLRVLNRNEIQGYAEVTARLRANKKETLKEAVASKLNSNMSNKASFASRFDFYENYVEHYSSGHLKTDDQA